LDQTVGILRCWWHCSATQARTELHARYDHLPDGEQRPGGPGFNLGVSAGMRAETARVVALTNAAADRFADPDLEGA
jgi:hypothetical protein